MKQFNCFQYMCGAATLAFGAGGLGQGNVMRITPGKNTADEWIKPGTGGLNGVLGVYGMRRAKRSGFVPTIWKARARRPR